jgi:hypothetical protein
LAAHITDAHVSTLINHTAGPRRACRQIRRLTTVAAMAACRNLVAFSVFLAVSVTGKRARSRSKSSKEAGSSCGITRAQLISRCAVLRVLINAVCFWGSPTHSPCRRSVQIVHHHQQLRVHGVAGDPVRRRFGRAGQHGLRARAGSVADALRAGGVVGPRVGPDPLLRGRHDDGQVRLRDGRLRVRPRWPSSRSTAAAAWTSTT